jgi:hypothetical protein
VCGKYLEVTIPDILVYEEHRAVEHKVLTKDILVLLQQVLLREEAIVFRLALVRVRAICTPGQPSQNIVIASKAHNSKKIKTIIQNQKRERI